MPKRTINIFIALLIPIGFISCTTSKKMSSKKLYEEAYRLYEDESYSRARYKFEEVIEKDPLNKYAVKSELHLADIFYLNKDYDDSIIHYEEYLRLNPKTSDHEYILYKIAMCHYNLMKTYDRDQTETDIAIEKIGEYIGSYPEGKYKDELINNRETAHKLKLRSEFNVGKFYFKTKDYKAAKTRCENIIKKFKDKDDIIQETYLILAESLVKLSNRDGLRSVYKDYLTVFPEGTYKEDIKNLLN